MIEKIKNDARIAIIELIEKSGIKEGEILVIGCSSSEMTGGIIGKSSAPEAAEALLDAIYPIIKEKNIFLAAQCCEHLNRAIVIENECREKFFLDEVNAVPQPKAGGSFATQAYRTFKNPVLVENIRANAGIDIGGTLIGMHIKAVCVPVRLSVKTIGAANIICAKSRPRLIGGERAVYKD